MALEGRSARAARGRPQDQLWWVAWARGPKGERVDGQGDSAEGALDALTNAMRQSGLAFKVE